MQAALPFVVFAAVLFSLVMSLAFLVTGRNTARGSVYDEIGRGGLTHEDGFAGGPAAADAESLVGRAEREREIRQMLQARSDRMVARGERALDVDAEVTKLLAGSQSSSRRDAGLEAEVRQLVVARNERRVRQGLEALDVEAETARTLQELDP